MNFDDNINSPQLSVFRASAGSGKTYRLTMEYLNLIFENPYNYKHILAVTFTNKATGEMKSRILLELYLLSVTKDSNYRNYLCEKFNLSQEKVQERANRILNLILHDYSRFSVFTIDSFYQTILRAFVKEIGLQAGFNLELDTAKILDKVIDRVFLDISANDILRNWLVRFTEDKIHSGKSWNLKSDMFDFGQEIFKEKFQLFDKELHEKLAGKDFIAQYLSSLNGVISYFENRMQQIGTEALEIMNKENLAIEDFIYGKAGIAGYFKKLTEKSDFEPTVRPRAGLNNPEAWHKKSDVNAEKITNAFNNGLNRLLGMAIDFYDNEHCKYNTGLHIANFIYLLGICTDITAKLREYIAEKNIFLISDTNRFLYEIIKNNNAPFIYEKTGNIYKYFMIDEFQDTSAMQWNNFKPLLNESLASGNRNLVVGDVKQSIYRWRNSDWNLLAEQINSDFAETIVKTENLKYNWRSKKNIIDFNNAVFQYAPEILKKLFVSQLTQAQSSLQYLSDIPEKITNAYRDTLQLLPDNNRQGGYVNIRFLKNHDKAWTAEVLEQLPKIIEQLQQKQYKLNDIAILVRTQKQGVDVARYMLEYKNSEKVIPGCKYDVISDEALYLGSSPAIRLLLFSLNYLNDPHNKINIAALINEYHRHSLNKAEIDKPLFVPGLVECAPLFAPDPLFALDLVECDLGARLKTSTNHGPLPSDMKKTFEELKLLPFYEQVEMLIAFFELNNIPSEFPYLQAFQDIILKLSKNNPVDLKTFLDWWEDEGNQHTISISNDQDAVRILTIHKAKGLEFRIVIVPFCNWELEHSGKFSNILWCNPYQEPFKTLGLVPVKYSSSLASTHFFKEYYTEKMQSYVDNLNLLYVAFTRAKEMLYAFCPAPKKDTDAIKAVSDVLYNILSVECTVDSAQNIISLHKSWSSQDLIFELGNISLRSEAEKKSEISEFNPDFYPAGIPKIQQKHKEAGREFFIATHAELQERINYGTLLHNIFENIHIPADAEKAVKKAVYEGRITSGEESMILQKIRAYLSQPQPVGWFSEKKQVKTEAAILLENGTTQRPDRVIIEGNKATVIDYKFATAESNKHKEQVKEYIEYLNKMGYADVEGYVWYPDLGRVIKV
ncbi:MAG: UvrD-helicase domain-containing protein [Bacteroidia bacterium]|nr:UvrD-helicase domain-containing protein [Bacteroidia bacterium]